MKKIEGRSDDVLYTKDGRRVGRLDPVFKNDLPIIEAQIIQNSLNDMVVKYVPAADFDEKSAKDLTERLCERMGDINVEFEKVATNSAHESRKISGGDLQSFGGRKSRIKPIKLCAELQEYTIKTAAMFRLKWLKHLAE